MVFVGYINELLMEPSVVYLNCLPIVPSIPLTSLTLKRSAEMAVEMFYGGNSVRLCVNEVIMLELKESC